MFAHDVHMRFGVGEKLATKCVSGRRLSVFVRLAALFYEKKKFLGFCLSVLKNIPPRGLMRSGVFCCVLVCSGLFWSVLICSGVFWCLLVYSGVF